MAKTSDGGYAPPDTTGTNAPVCSSGCAGTSSASPPQAKTEDPDLAAHMPTGAR